MICWLKFFKNHENKITATFLVKVVMDVFRLYRAPSIENFETKATLPLHSVLEYRPQRLSIFLWKRKRDFEELFKRGDTVQFTI